MVNSHHHAGQDKLDCGMATRPWGWPREVMEMASMANEIDPLIDLGHGDGDGLEQVSRSVSRTLADCQRPAALVTTRDTRAGLSIAHKT